MSATAVEDLLRPLVPQVLGALTRRYGHFDQAEEATQEALLAAARQWPEQGTPDDPKAWLITVASRRLTDLLRSEDGRRRREERADLRDAAADQTTPAHHDRTVADHGRHAHGPVPLLPPGAVGTVAAGPDAARRRRPHHGRDRGGVPRARVDHGPTHQPSQADRRRRRRPVRDARRRRPDRAPDDRRPRALPDVQRGLRHLRRRPPPTRRPHRRGDPPHPPGPRRAARRGRGRRAARPDAAHRRPPRRPHHRGRRPRPARRAGSLPVGP